MKSRAEGMKGSAERVDDMIGKDRDELLEEYCSSGEGRKRAAAIFLVAGGDVARGAGGALASGLLVSKGVWIAAAILGLAGVGFLGLELVNGDQSPPGDAVLQKKEQREQVEQPLANTAPTTSTPADSTAAAPVDLIRPERSSARSLPALEESVSDPKATPSLEGENEGSLHREEGERRVRRREEVSTTVTIEVQSRNDQ